MPATARVRALSAMVTAKVCSKMRRETALRPRWSTTWAVEEGGAEVGDERAAPPSGSARTAMRRRSRSGQRAVRASTRDHDLALGVAVVGVDRGDRQRSRRRRGSGSVEGVAERGGRSGGRAARRRAPPRRGRRGPRRRGGGEERPVVAVGGVVAEAVELDRPVAEAGRGRSRSAGRRRPPGGRRARRRSRRPRRRRGR